MKVLILGAGVLGSYLAHVLHRGGADVTLFSRGDWKKHIEKDGIVIRHYLQCRTTVDRVEVTDTLLPEDEYDMIFVVVRYAQMDSIIPILKPNRSKRIVFVGNDITPKKYRDLLPDKEVLFGFQGSAGRREAGRVVSVHTRGKMIIGSLDQRTDWQDTIRAAFQNTKYRLVFNKNMNGWLKYHIVFVLPLAYACYAYEGNLKKIASNKKLLNQIIDAIDNGYRVLEALGYYMDPPEDTDYVRNHRRKCYFLLKFMMATPIGKLAISDHAMSAYDEMMNLSQSFDLLKAQSGIDTSAWDLLEVESENYGRKVGNKSV